MDNNLELLNGLRGPISSEKYMEIISVATVFEYLDRKDGANRIAHLMRASGDSVQELMTIIKKVENDYPYFSNVFEQLVSINELNVSQLSRFWFDFKGLMDSTYSLSHWYEEFLGNYNSVVGKRGGEHSTPKVINDLAVQLLNPIDGTFNDSMCGFGGSLKTAKDFAKEREGSLQVFGQEINPQAWAIAKIRLYISDEKPEIHQGDVFTNPSFVNGDKVQKFDYAFIDTPFGMPLNQQAALADDRYNRFLFGTPPKRSSELAVLSHVIASLKEDGQAVVVVPSGTLFRSGAEAQIRKNIISLDLIEAVIALPSGLYDNTSIASNLIYLNKKKDVSKKDKIVFINAENEYEEVNRRKRTMSPQTIEKIVSTINDTNTLIEFSAVVDVKDIQDGDLFPNRYVTSTDMEISGVGTVEFSIEQFKDVDTVPLKELVTFFRGFNVSANDESPNGEYKVVRISDVQKGQLIMENVAQYNVENNAKLETYRLLKDDVIVTIRGQAIKAAHISTDDENLLLSQNFMGIRCGSTLNPMYLKMYLESPLGQYLLSSKLTGTAVPTLTKKELENLEVPMKSIQEQNEIVTKYVEKEEMIIAMIEELEQDLFAAKLDVYQGMGIKETFTIKN